MMIIPLRGYSPDRHLNVLQHMLVAHGLEPIDGYFTGDSFVVVDDVPETAVALIANTFAPILLDQGRAEAIVAINTQAGEERSRYATNIPFQGDLYQLKEREALLFQSDRYPSSESYPILYAEAEARSLPTATVAAEYLANAAQLPRILAAIEGVRMGAITAIKNAASIAEIEAVLGAVEWPTF